MLRVLGDSSRTSSFIQNTLYEDSCAGIAIVDLFVAVKIVKDKIDILAQCNNDFFEKIMLLNRDTMSIKVGYENLIDKVRELLRVTTEKNPNEFTKRSNLECWRQESEEQVAYSNKSTNLELEMLNSENHKECLPKSPNNKCYCCGSKLPPENLQESCSAEGEETKSEHVCSCRQKCTEERKLDCLGCLWSIFSDMDRTEVPLLNKALLGSFIVSLLWFQKREGLCIPLMNPKMISQILRKIKKDENLNFCESNVQMISEIFEIITGIDFDQPSESEGELRPESFSIDEDVHESSGPSHDDNSSYQTLDEEDHVSVSNSEGRSKSKEDLGSDSESVFEEALTELSLPSEMRKHNLSYVRDFSINLAGKKNINTFTAKGDAMSSWLSKLVDDIKVKIKNMKSKTNVKALKKLSKPYELAITANTPVGVFDVTVMQHSKRRQSREPLRKLGKPVQRLHSKEPEKHCQLPVKASNVKGDNGDEGLLKFGYENSKKKEKTVTLIPDKISLETYDLKLVKSPYFEIQKCYPIFFAQEIIRKTLNEEPREWSDMSTSNETEIVSVDSSEKQQREIVIQRSSSDIVIYIQVEVGDKNPGELFMEYQTSTHGTQTKDTPSSSFPYEERVIKLQEEKQDGDSLFHIWENYERENWLRTEEKPRITTGKHLKLIGDEELDIREELEIREEILEGDDEKREVIVKEPKEKTVTFSEMPSEILAERETQDIYPEEEEEEEDSLRMETRKYITARNAKLHTDIWLFQNALSAVQKAEIINPRVQRQQTQDIEEEEFRKHQLDNFVETVVLSNVELQKALNLIHEIENDVISVKLNDAISILPRLESELRKHLQNKIKNIREEDPDKESSFDNFFSAVDFWPYELAEEIESDDSEEKLGNLLKLLSDLEEAVRINEYSNHHLEFLEFGPAVIYKLLHALSKSIKELEEVANVSSLSQTLDIASQLDAAVRNFDSVIKKQSFGYMSSDSEKQTPIIRSQYLEKTLVSEQLQNVRKKVFDMVEEEAYDIEGRIERDFDRLDRLGRENDETMMFLEAFLRKTERRTAEYESLKIELQKMTLSIKTLCEKISRTKKLKYKKPSEFKKFDSLNSSVLKISTVQENETVKETISELLIALDNLKTRAREKNEMCTEILSWAFDRALVSEKSSHQLSRSSFTAKQVETMTTVVKDFKKIGESSLYLSWTKPEASSSVSVLGYEIHVNGQLNQKVRNPQRLQAVLYSVDLSKETDIHLYALVDTGYKILLANLTY